MLIPTFKKLSMTTSQLPSPVALAIVTLMSSRFMQKLFNNHLLGNFYYTNHLLHCQVKLLFRILNCLTDSSRKLI